LKRIFAPALLLLALNTVHAGDAVVIAQDSAGLVVEFKEKYGPVVIDTGTVLMAHYGSFVLVKRDRGSAWFPMANYSQRVLHPVEKDGENE
jgi:hypothetical protein